MILNVGDVYSGGGKEWLLPSDLARKISKPKDQVKVVNVSNPGSFGDHFEKFMKDWLRKSRADFIKLAGSSRRSASMSTVSPFTWDMDLPKAKPKPTLIEGNPNKVPKEWRELLAVVRSVSPNAVIAGGCLRDNDMGVEPKDIDIWVYAESFNQMKTLHAKLKTVGFKLKPMKEDCDESDYPEEFGSELVSIIRGKHHITGDMPIEIIGTTMQGPIVNRFDLAFCQIMFDGEYVWRTNEYQEDRKNKTFTLILKRSPVQLERTVDRYAHLRKRYPQWRFKIANNLLGTDGDFTLQF